MTAGRSAGETREAERRRRPRGAVHDGLVVAGLELARAGGPDAVVLREATRMVGVVPNAAYRHFANRDELLAAVCTEGADAIRAASVSVIPLGRLGRPEEVAAAALFLASDESSFCAGMDLSVEAEWRKSEER